jgi:D-glycero-D-manno-heptose 1,7-bisphosphate phosphatase
MAIKTIFLDRDGVINKEVNYLYRIEEFVFLDGIFEACNYFQSIGFEIIIITNQSGIGQGFYSKNDFKILTDWMLEQFQNKNIKILDIFYCPHGQNSHCNCRKPMPGMILEAQKKHGIDLNLSWMIGDKESDIISANAAGVKNTILLRSGHKIDENSSKASFIENSILETLNTIIN